MEVTAPTDQSTCGAKTKDGSPCRKLPCSGRFRCRLHGGASPRGIAHPRFVHGAYSQCVVFSLPEKWRRLEEKQRKRSARLLARCHRAYEMACERAQKQREAQAAAAAQGKRGRGRPRLYREPDYLRFCRAWLQKERLRQREKDQEKDQEKPRERRQELRLSR